MKKVFILVSISLFALSVWADEVGSQAGNDRPCTKIHQACKAAGFVKGEAKEGKGLFVNCMKPVLDGKTVPGVTVDAATIQACKDKKSKRAKRHGKG